MDKYDKAIAYLYAHPDEIDAAWGSPINHNAGCLFGFAGADAHYSSTVGCLTQIQESYIRNNGNISAMFYVAETNDLTVAIGSDDRIPSDPSEIMVSDLPVFAEWQRRLDEELGRG